MACVDVRVSFWALWKEMPVRLAIFYTHTHTHTELGFGYELYLLVLRRETKPRQHAASLPVSIASLSRVS